MSSPIARPNTGTLLLQKQSRINVDQVIPKWGVRNARIAKRRHNEDYGHHHPQIDQWPWEQARGNVHHPQEHALRTGTMIRPPRHRHPWSQVQGHHRRPRLGVCCTSEPGCIRSSSTRAGSISRTTRFDRCTAQDQRMGLCKLPRGPRSGQGTPTVRSGWRRSRHTEKTVHKFRRRDHPINDTPPTNEDGYQDDDVPKIQIQGCRIQGPMGPDHKHLRLLHPTREVQEFPRRPRHRDEWRQNDLGGGRTNVGIRDVHGRPAHPVGQSTQCTKNVANTPGLLHSKVARTSKNTHRQWRNSCGSKMPP